MGDVEMGVRKKVLREFNMRREDFGTLREWNDYLEEVEEIIQNLTTQTDVAATEERIRRYRDEHRDVTALNTSKRAEEERAAAQRIRSEETVARRILNSDMRSSGGIPQTQVSPKASTSPPIRPPSTSAAKAGSVAATLASASVPQSKQPKAQIQTTNTNSSTSANTARASATAAIAVPKPVPMAPPTVSYRPAFIPVLQPQPVSSVSPTGAVPSVSPVPASAESRGTITEDIAGGYDQSIVLARTLEEMLSFS